MSIRTFLFCDYCNADAIRTIDRRATARPYGLSGRRNTDGRSWFDGTRKEAALSGWRIDEENQDICPRCQERGLGAFGPSNPGEAAT